MHRYLLLALLAMSVFGGGEPARAQATADQLNRLSLEALTAHPAGGGGGTPSYRSRSRASSRGYGVRRYGRPRYATASRYHATSRHGRASHSVATSYRHRSYRR